MQITPGSGGLYCGNCLRDNALVMALRQLGHEVLMIPLYLALTLDEEDQSAGTPLFFGGLNVFLEQKSALFRKAPGWVHKALNSPALLKLAAGQAVKTRPELAGELTLSMLRGEEGRQAREIEELTGWLKANERPDVFCLSNVLLTGLARRLKRELGAPVVCTMQGEDAFLDALPETVRAQSWATLAERARDVDLFIAPSRYFAEVMGRRLGIEARRIEIIPNGINLAGYAPAPGPPDPPVLGFFARMSPQKGLDTLVKAYLLLRQRGRIKDLKLRVGGACLPIDEPFVNSLRQELQAAGLAGEAEFLPNLDRASKQEFYRSLSVFSVPAGMGRAGCPQHAGSDDHGRDLRRAEDSPPYLYGEAFGLYLLEAWASGLPVVQPRHGAFPELLDATLGGVLCAPGDATALADALEPLLADVILARGMGQAGRKAVVENFTSARMAERMVEAFQRVRVNTK